MKYTVEIAGREIEVEIEGDEVRLEGKDAKAILEGRPGGVIRRLARGGSSRSFQVLAGDGRGAWRLLAQGQRLDAVVLDPRTRAGQGAGPRGAAPHKGTVRAPMPGKVLRVLVEAGLEVKPGQALIVVEAMKMENELKAPGAGTVGKVHVRAGDTVEKGAVLLDLA